MNNDLLSLGSERASNGFVWRAAIVLGVDKVVDDLDFAIRAKGFVGGFPQIVGDRRHRVGLFDPEPGNRQERRIAADQRYVGSVKRGHYGQTADVL